MKVVRHFKFAVRGTSDGSRLPSILGTALGIIVLFCILLWRTILEFLPSAAGALSVAAAMVVVTVLIVRWFISSGIETSGFANLVANFLSLLLILLMVGMMLYFVSCATLWGYTVFFGKPVAFETTVEKKIKTMSYHIRIKESDAFYSKNPTVDIFTWNDISTGDTIIIQGRESFFGVSISDINRKR
jgi:hypothetical protein